MVSPDKYLRSTEEPGSWKLERVRALVWSVKVKTRPLIKLLMLKDVLLFEFGSMLWRLLALLFTFSTCPLDLLSIWLSYKTVNTRGCPSRSWEWCLGLGRILGFLSWRLWALKSTLVWTLEGSSVHFMAAAFVSNNCMLLHSSRACWLSIHWVQPLESQPSLLPWKATQMWTLNSPVTWEMFEPSSLIKRILSDARLPLYYLERCLGSLKLARLAQPFFVCPFPVGTHWLIETKMLKQYLYSNAFNERRQSACVCFLRWDWRCSLVFLQDN